MEPTDEMTGRAYRAFRAAKEAGCYDASAVVLALEAALADVPEPGCCCPVQMGREHERGKVFIDTACPVHGRLAKE